MDWIFRNVNSREYEPWIYIFHINISVYTHHALTNFVLVLTLIYILDKNKPNLSLLLKMNLTFATSYTSETGKFYKTGFPLGRSVSVEEKITFLIFVTDKWFLKHVFLPYGSSR